MRRHYKTCYSTTNILFTFKSVHVCVPPSLYPNCSSNCQTLHLKHLLKGDFLQIPLRCGCPNKSISINEFEFPSVTEVVNPSTLFSSSSYHLSNTTYWRHVLQMNFCRTWPLCRYILVFVGTFTVENDHK